MDNIRQLGVHIELTSNCNSRCLDCDRFIVGTDIVNPYIDTGSSGLMSLDAIDNIFDDTIAATARYVNFTGTYGDAILHPDFLKICELIADKIDSVANKRISNGVSSKLTFMLETNAGLRDIDWWTKLANIINTRYHPSRSKIYFALDGIDNDTHQMYRRGVNFDTVIQNAKAVIDNNVNSVWSFIEFSHNADQIDKARDMAKHVGFREFSIRRSRLRTAVNLPKKMTNVLQRKSGISTDVLTWSNEQKQVLNTISEVSEDISSRMMFENQYKSEWTDTDIICEWKKNRSISIDYTGRVWQCCFFSTFYHSGMNVKQLKRFGDGLNVNRKTQEYENLSYYEDQYDEHWNNVNVYQLSRILNHQFFTTDLPDSFKNQIDSEKNPRIYRCGKFCGEKTREQDTKLKNIHRNK